MITFEQIKQITIKVEQEWVMEVAGENGLDYIQGTINEINSCDTFDDLVKWYGDRGYNNDEAYRNIITNLMEFGTINK